MIHTIILAGGSGTRFWPLSREDKPKQLLRLFSDKTLLEETIERSNLFSDKVHISTGKNLENPINELNTGCNLIIEPCRRDTAAAIGLCMTKFDDEDTLVFTPSDAFIKEVDKFSATIKKAIELAQSAITVIGITPNRPATAYGYLEVDGTKVNSFREKPDEETAMQYLAKGYLWNAGIFVVKVSVLRALFEEFEPEIGAKLNEIKETGNIEDIFPTIKKISFDYAIMEKAKDVNFVPANFYWNDVGSFDAVGEVIGGENTAINGEIQTINSHGNIVYSKKRITLIDCEDLVVIDTDDELLVCPKSSVQKIKKLNE